MPARRFGRWLGCRSRRCDCSPSISSCATRETALRARLRHSGALPRNPRRVGPQSLEAIELACRGQEHVHDEVPVVEEYPGRVVEPFDRARLDADLLSELLLDF